MQFKPLTLTIIELYCTVYYFNPVIIYSFRSVSSVDRIQPAKNTTRPRLGNIPKSVVRRSVRTIRELGLWFTGLPHPELNVKYTKWATPILLNTRRNNRPCRFLISL